MGPSPTEENLRWELQQAKTRIEQLEAEVESLNYQLQLAQVESLHYQLEPWE
jgi:hypothetical protein